MAKLEVKAFGFEMAAKRNLFHLELTGLETFPEQLPLFSSYYTLFIACDSQNIPAEVLAQFAERALGTGAVYVCAWGLGCERVHDIFDETIVEGRIKSDAAEHISSTVMTTWHSDGTVEDALEFFLTAANPDAAAAGMCKAALTVSVGNQDWASRIDGILLSQVPAEARTYIYSGSPDSRMWIRDDFEEPLEEFAEYM